MHGTLRSRLIVPAVISLFLFGLLAACGSEETEQAEADVPEEMVQQSIADQLTARREGFREKAPAEAKQVLAQSLDSLRQSGILESALTVGDTIPRFELANAVGDPVNISDLLAKGPIVLVFYRGNW